MSIATSPLRALMSAVAILLGLTSTLFALTVHLPASRASLETASETVTDPTVVGTGETGPSTSPVPVGPTYRDSPSLREAQPRVDSGATEGDSESNDPSATTTTTEPPVDPLSIITVGTTRIDPERAPSPPTSVVSEPAGVADIGIETTTNGLEDDQAPGPELEIGSRAMFAYLVTNTGTVTLTDIEVHDDILGPICLAGPLEPTETATCQLPDIVADGPYVSSGRASGQAVNAFGSPVGERVQSSDPTFHVGVAPPPLAPAGGSAASRPCEATTDGPRLFAGDRVVWDTSTDAIAGSTLVVETREPGGSPDQPHEQVFVVVGDDVYGPTPVGLGTIEIDVIRTGRLMFVHHSVITDDVSLPNSVEVSYCGTALRPTQGAACAESIDGPELSAHGQNRFDTGMTAAAGSVVRITSAGPADMTLGPNQQVWVKVGVELFGPTPTSFGTIEFTATLGGEVIILHHSRVTGDGSAANAVDYVLCGTHLSTIG